MASRWSLAICSLVLSVCRAIPAPTSSHLQSSREPLLHTSSISIFPIPERSHTQGFMISRPFGASVRASASGTAPSIHNVTVQTLSLLNPSTPRSFSAAQSSTPPPTITETTLPPEVSLQTLSSGAYLSNQWITTTPPGSSSATVVPVIIPPDLNDPIVLWNVLPGPPPGGEFPTLPHLEINAPKAPCIRIFGMSIGSCPSKPKGQNLQPSEPNPNRNPNPNLNSNPKPDPDPTQEPSQSLSRSSEASSSSCTSSMATVTSISWASLGISSSCTTAYTTKDGCDVTGSLTSTAACISQTTINGKTFCCPSTTVIKGSTVCALPPLTVEDVLVAGTVRQESVGSVELMDQLRSYVAMQSRSLLASGASQSLPQTVPSSGFTASAPSRAANSSILHSLVSASPGSQPIASLPSASSTVSPLSLHAPFSMPSASWSASPSSNFSPFSRLQPSGTQDVSMTMSSSPSSSLSQPTSTAASASAPGSGSSLPTASQFPPSSLSADTASSALSSSASSGTAVSASSSSASSGTTVFASSSSASSGTTIFASSSSSDTAVSVSPASASSGAALSSSSSSASSDSAVSASSSSASSDSAVSASSSSTALCASPSSAPSGAALSASPSSASSDTAVSASPISASSQSTGFPGGTSSASSTQPLITSAPPTNVPGANGLDSCVLRLLGDPTNPGFCSGTDYCECGSFGVAPSLSPTVTTSAGTTVTTLVPVCTQISIQPTAASCPPNTDTMAPAASVAAATASAASVLAAYIASSQSVAAQPTASAQCFPYHDINVLQDSKPDMDNFCASTNSTLQDGTFWDPSYGAPASPNYGTTTLDPASAVMNNNILAGFTIASDASPGCQELFYPVSPNFATLACSAALKQIVRDCPYNGGKASNACGEWWTMTCPLDTHCPVGCPGGAFGVGDSRCGTP